jgi:hypothetical protein
MQRILREIIKELETKKVQPSARPRGAASEPWWVGFNDALAEAVEVVEARLPKKRKR